MKAVDFFCGGGGMTEGLKMAGIQVLAGVDVDADCQKTYESNHPESLYLRKDVQSFSACELSSKIEEFHGVGIKKFDDDLVFIGCSPCQYWSILKTNRQKSRKTKDLILDFQKFVEFYMPGHIVIENVPGLASKENSPLKKFINSIRSLGYHFIDDKVVKVEDYGVPQSRKRYILIASRCEKINIPKPLSESEDYIIPTVREFIGDYNVFPEIEAGHRDKTDFMHTAAGLKEISLNRLKLTPIDGGDRTSWSNTNLQIQAYKKHRDNSSFGFKDVYGRMYWDRPAPTITTKFFGISHGRFAHPEQNRAISLREGATLQTFPIDYKFCGSSIASIARQIGNAVPVKLSYYIGLTLNGEN